MRWANDRISSAVVTITTELRTALPLKSARTCCSANPEKRDQQTTREWTLNLVRKHPRKSPVKIPEAAVGGTLLCLPILRYSRLKYLQQADGLRGGRWKFPKVSPKAGSLTLANSRFAPKVPFAC